jgi:predicted unusual protein kinase regulating ubiquinone biosynthesis (AarF/ABC1/UbiB family)
MVKVHFLKEVKAQFLTEFDYTHEAENLRRVWHNLQPMFGDEVGVGIPRVDLVFGFLSWVV